MKRFFNLSLCLFTLLFVISACSESGKSSSKNEESESFESVKSSSKNEETTIIGTWIQEVYQDGITAVSTYEFDDNGRMFQEVSMASSTPRMHIEASGPCDYTYENDIITFKCSSSDISFSEFYIEGVEDEAIEQSMAQMRSQMSSITNQITNVKINGNTLTGIFNGNQITLKRI